MPSTPTNRLSSRRRHLLGVLLALIMVLAGCGGDEEPPSSQAPSGPPEEPVTIRLGWGTPGQEAFYVMQAHPEVAPNLGTWYDIEWTQLGAPQFIQALASGVVDGGALGPLSFANATEQGADFVLTGQMIEEREPNTPLTWLVTNESGITEPADLAGEAVATIGEASSLDYLQDYYIQAEGGLEAGTGYQKVELAFPLMQDALLGGQIATGPFPPPFLQQALATGEVRPLFTVLDVLPVSVAVLQAFRRDFVEENRTAVEKFMEDWVTVNRWVADPANRDQVIQATNQATEIPVEVLDRYLLTEEDGARSPTGAINLEAVQSNWDFFREQGAFTQELKVDDYVIPELLPPPS